MTTIKASISAKFRELENKLGYLVFTFNSNRYMRGSCNGWVDHVLVDPKILKIWFIEIKIGKDRLTARQQLLQWTLKKIESLVGVIYYRVVTEINIEYVIGEIVNGH